MGDTYLRIREQIENSKEMIKVSEELIRKERKAIDNQNARIKALQSQAEEIHTGYNGEFLEIARSILYIKGDPHKVNHGFDINQSGVRISAIEDAIGDILSNGHTFTEQYRGVKNYDGFGDQRSDHPYGYGPKHGSIVFEVGMRRAIRDRIKDSSPPPLTEKEKGACLYYLDLLKEGKISP